MLDEFKKFLFRGNVVDLAVAVIIGAAFAAIVAAVTTACEREGVRHQPMISRAYHDSLFMSRLAPTGMIFIPCRGGVSHRPDEYASPEAIAKGAAVLARTLATLAAGG